MVKQFREVGLVLLTNTQLKGKKGLIEQWSKVPMGGTWKYEGGANERNYKKMETNRKQIRYLSVKAFDDFF